MKKSLTIFLLFFIGVVYSQDQLFKKDNTKTEVKILEINQTEIKYKLFNYLDGPTIIIAKTDVAMIIYQNGTHEVFNTKAEPSTVIVYKEGNEKQQHKDADEAQKFAEFTSTKHLVSFNILEPLNGTFSMSYVREFANNLFHLYIPVSTGFAEPFFNQPGNTIFSTNRYNYFNISDFKFTRKVVESGIGIHFQTSTKKTVTHFIGPYFGIAQYNGTFRAYKYTYDPIYGYYNNSPTSDHGFVMNRYYLMLDNGFLFRINKNFNIILTGGLGRHIDIFVANNPEDYNSQHGYYTNYGSNFPINSFKLGLSMGYRF